MSDKKIVVGKPRWPVEIMNFHRNNVLGWIKKNYNPQRIYYPGSGFDKVPKLFFGEDKVFHVSLEENRDVVDGGYFKILGSGIKVVADMRFSPFKSNFFNLVVLHGVPKKVLLKSTHEFLRVLRVGGLILFDFEAKSVEEENELTAELSYICHEVSLPEELESGLESYTIPLGPGIGAVVRKGQCAVMQRELNPDSYPNKVIKPTKEKHMVRLFQKK